MTRKISVNAPSGEVAMQLVAREVARRGMTGARVTGFAPVDKRPDTEVAVFTTVPAAQTFLVTVEVPD